MSERNTDDYYRRREQRERGLAAAACDPDIAAIHRQMAERYAEMIALPVLVARSG